MKIFLVFPLFFVLSSCASYKCGNVKFLKAPPCEQVRCNEIDASHHWLYQFVPRHRCQIRCYDLFHWTTWMLFGNDDNGVFGESTSRPYKLYYKNNFPKAVQWWVRNPLHNFTNYTIGSRHGENGEFTLLNLNPHKFQCCHYEKVASHNYGCRKCSSFFAGFHGGKPFLSLRILYPWQWKTEIYLGWRKGGSFGFKFLPMINEKRHKECFFKVE
jgi:hypothetical protein